MFIWDGFHRQHVLLFHSNDHSQFFDFEVISALTLPSVFQVEEVKGVMTDNIDKMLQRGEKLELLTDKTENLMSEVSAT
jgi:hypothetical protein